MAGQKIEVIGFENFDKILEETGRELETVVIELSQDVSNALVVRTPYITGNLRASWYSSLNTARVDGMVMAGVSDTIKKSEPAAQTAAKMAMAMARYKAGDTLYFINSAHYAGYVEYGTWKMAPRAWVRGVLAELPLFVNNVIRRIQRRRTS